MVGLIRWSFCNLLFFLFMFCVYCYGFSVWIVCFCNYSTFMVISFLFESLSMVVDFSCRSRFIMVVFHPKSSKSPQPLVAMPNQIVSIGDLRQVFWLCAINFNINSLVLPRAYGCICVPLYAWKLEFFFNEIFYVFYK